MLAKAPEKKKVHSLHSTTGPAGPTIAWFILHWVSLFRRDQQFAPWTTLPFLAYSMCHVRVGSLSMRPLIVFLSFEDVGQSCFSFDTQRFAVFSDAMV